MTKVLSIKSAQHHAVSANAAQKVLQKSFEMFGSLEPNKETVATEILAICGGDLSALSRLGEALSAVDCDQITTFEWHGWGVTLITPTSGTRIQVRRNNSDSRFQIHVDFGPQGSEGRAEQFHKAFREGGVEYWDTCPDAAA